MFYRNLLIMHGLTIKHLVNSGDKGLVTCFHWCYLYAACSLHPSIMQDAARCLVIHSGRNIKVCQEHKTGVMRKKWQFVNTWNWSKVDWFFVLIFHGVIKYWLMICMFLKLKIGWIVCSASVRRHTADIVGSHHSVIFDIVLTLIML